MKVTQPIVTQVNNVLEGRAHICGGAILSCFQGSLPVDIDIFIENEEDYLQVCADLYNHLMNPKSIDEWMCVVEECKDEGNYWAYEFQYEGVTISVITPQLMCGRQTWGTVEEIVDEIDISICRMGLRADNTIYFADESSDTLGQIVNWFFKIVKQRPEEEADRTAKRIEKYKAKGYRYLDTGSRMPLNMEDVVQNAQAKAKKLNDIRPASMQELADAVEKHTGSNKKVLKKILKQSKTKNWKQLKREAK